MDQCCAKPQSVCSYVKYPRANFFDDILGKPSATVASLTILPKVLKTVTSKRLLKFELK